MKHTVLIKDKYLLSVEEAAAYFGIGENKLRKIANENLENGFILQNGARILFNRKKFEEYLDKTLMV